MKTIKNIIIILLMFTATNQSTAQLRVQYHLGMTGSIMYYERFSTIPPLLTPIEGEPLSEYYLFPLFRPTVGVGLQYDLGKYSISGGAHLKILGSYKDPYQWHPSTGFNDMTTSFTFWTFPLDLSYQLNKQWAIFGGAALYWTLLKSHNYFQGKIVGYDGTNWSIDVDHSANPYRNFNASVSAGVERTLSKHFGLRLSYEYLLFSPVRTYGGKYEIETKYTVQALNLGLVFRP
jgi:opacity protein-like surface antigen